MEDDTDRPDSPETPDPCPDEAPAPVPAHHEIAPPSVDVTIEP